MKKFLLWILIAVAIVSAAFYFGYISHQRVKVTDKNIEALKPAGAVASKAKIISYLTASDASFNSLQKNISTLNVVIGEWLNFYDADGLKLISADQQKAKIDYLHLVQKNSKDLQIFALLKNYSGGNWRGNEVAGLLADAELRAKLIQQITDYLSANALNGLSVDFENLPASAQNNFVLFLTELHKQLQQKNLQLSVNLPADDLALNYTNFANVADQIIIMFYDQHNSATEPGAIAALPWFNELLQQRIKDIGNNKLIVGLGNYAYDWSAGGASGITVATAQATALAHQSPLIFDKVAQNNFYKYTDQGNREHTVWILDAVSVAAEVQTAEPLNPYGFALYRLGSEDQQAWQQFPR